MYGSADQLQYMAWIRDASAHVLASNLFQATPDRHVFLQPMFTFSGILVRSGVPIQIAFLLWEPVAVVVLLIGVLAYARRLMILPLDQVMCAALGLFYFSPLAAAVHWSGVGSPEDAFGFVTISIETFNAGALWGYAPSAITIGLVPLVFIGSERALAANRDTGPRTTALVLSSVAALIASWLHPWQGATIVVALAGLLIWARLRGSALSLLPIIVGAGLPLAYYGLLGHLSGAWALASTANNFPHLRVWLLALAPIALLAAVGVRRPGEDLQERILLLWPVAAMIVYLALNRSFFYHALEGLSIPLGVMSIRGMERLRLPRLGTAGAIMLLTVPGMAFAVQTLERTATAPAPDYFIEPDDARALAYLSTSLRPGAVMARLQTGQYVPAFTGHSTWLGNYEWTPDFYGRVGTADALFSGHLPPARAREVVRAAAVRYIMVSCHDGDAIHALVRSWIVAESHFGCAAVYELN
jgi:hypothetical protein